MLPIRDIRFTLWGWIGLSLLMHVLTRLLLWRFRHPRPGRLALWVERLRDSPYTSWIASFSRAAYFLVLPYVLLLRGITNARWMGLVGLDWPRSLGMGVPLAAAVVVMLVGGIGYHQRVTHHSAHFPRAEIVARQGGWGGLWPVVVYREVHWAFYRSGTLALGWGHYAGVFGALVPILLEQMLDPFVRRDVSHPTQSLSTLLTIVLALLSTVWFYLTANLWMAISLHWAVEFVVLRFVHAQSPPLVPTGRPAMHTHLES